MNAGYVGSSPYCYSNSLAMVLGPMSPPVQSLEFLSGSPFGFHLLGGVVPLCSPYRWDPIVGVTQVLELLGWEATRSTSNDPIEAIEKLRIDCRNAPVLAGPFEMGLLLHHPGSGQPILADHFVAVLEVTDDGVRFHDPHGFPHSYLPIETFCDAWRADTIAYRDRPFGMWSNFAPTELCAPLSDALRSGVERGRIWMRCGVDEVLPHGSVAGAEALNTLADLTATGLQQWQRDHLVHFAIRVGTRRFADASHVLASLDLSHAAALFDQQSVLLGRLQYELTRPGQDSAAATTLRALARVHEATEGDDFG